MSDTKTLEESLRPTIRALAHQYAGPRVAFDDVAQELNIALWQFQQTRPPQETDENYVGLCASRLRTRARDFFRFGIATGMPRQRRGTVDPIRHGVDVPLDYTEHERAAVDEQTFAPEIAAAVSGLAERDRLIVWERAVVGKSWPEISRSPGIGLTAGGLSNRWSTVIRPRLAAALAEFRK